MNIPNYVTAYKQHLASLIEIHGKEEAMALVVGGDYEQIGVLERSALISLGLKPSHNVIDVGCGSGRLPFALKDWSKGIYVGTDIMEEALDYAKEKCDRKDWKFISNFDQSIPVENSIADFVTFFSVFTHLLDEDIYRFLLEAKRVSKPNGKIIFTFLDFECESHWSIFEKYLEDLNPNRVINKFLSKDAIRRWARKIGLKEERLIDGSQKWIKLSTPFEYSDGRIAQGTVAFGQSIAVFKN
jgi:ubiquinone/menaquinone biosynthesis C-methylase UbiE